MGIKNDMGLKKAYTSKNKIHVYKNKMYIAGTSDIQDVWDDISKLPFGLTKYSKRYKDAIEEMNKHPQVDTVIGHSLGGSVALELEKNLKDRSLETTTYNAPVFTESSKKGKRFRHAFDPVSMFDKGAITETFNVYPHSYEGFE